MANEHQQVEPSTGGALGITGLAVNAVALKAPVAFLWLTFQMQFLYGAPMAGISMWVGILLALLLCFAVAISCSECGLRSTLTFTPVLLLQLSYKTIWVIGVVFPILLTGKVPSYAVFVM